MFDISGIDFYKFLPHCKEKFFKSYVDQLVEELRKQHQATDHPDTLPNKAFLELRQELCFNYEQVMSDPKKHSFNVLCWREGIWGKRRAFRSREGNDSLSATEGSAFIIVVYLTSFPYIHGILFPPEEFHTLTDEINQQFFQKYHHFLVNNLQTGLVDLIFCSQQKRFLFFSKDPVIGKAKWIYVDKKIKIREESHGLFSVSNHNSQNELSILFNFVEEISPLNIMENVTMLVNSKRMIKKFLTKQDKLLLDTWGEKEFANKLQPFGLSLKEWLKAT